MVDQRTRPCNRQITLICEVFSQPALDGHFVGRVQVVATGEVVTIRNDEELTDLLRRLSDDS